MSWRHPSYREQKDRVIRRTHAGRRGQEFPVFIVSALCVLVAAAIPPAFALFGLRGNR